MGQAAQKSAHKGRCNQAAKNQGKKGEILMSTVAPKVESTEANTLFNLFFKQRLAWETWWVSNTSEQSV